MPAMTNLFLRSVLLLKVSPRRFHPVCCWQPQTIVPEEYLALLNQGMNANFAHIQKAV
jgi:hypothetical protein